MSEPTTQPAAAAPTTYPELLRWAYEGEVFGAAFLQRMLEVHAHPDHHVDLQLLHALEEDTRVSLEPLIDRHALAIDEASALASAAQFAGRAAAMSWPEFMSETQHIAHDALPLFRRLRDTGGISEPGDAAVLDTVLAHEQALAAFAEHQLAGDTDAAASVLRSHLAATSAHR